MEIDENKTLNKCIKEMQKLSIQSTGYDNSAEMVLVYFYMYTFTAVLTLTIGFYIYFRLK